MTLRNNISICTLLIAIALASGCRSFRNQELPDGYFRETDDVNRESEFRMPFQRGSAENSKRLNSGKTDEIAMNSSDSAPSKTQIVRAQDPGSNGGTLHVASGEFRPTATYTNYQTQQPQSPQQPAGFSGLRDSNVSQAGYQYPELGATGPSSPIQSPTERLGAPNEINQLVSPYPPSGVGTFPGNYLDQQYADLIVSASESQTGRINIGGAYNSDNGLVGNFIIDERNFDIRRFPRSWREVTDGTAWRGAGQGFRLELVPGNNVQRYMVNFTEPYLFDSAISLSLSAFYFTRNYFDWNEQRLGGRIAFGYRLTQDLSVSLGLRMEDVKLFDPRVNTSTLLNNSLGSTDLFVGQFNIVNDTRDHPFLPTDGVYLSLGLSQAFGEASFSRADVEMRRYHLIYERADHSGRHTISYGSRLGFSGSNTPIFENYFAGGFSTMRGFNFRGMGPVEGGVRTGGTFQWLNTVEYMFPLTADDMIRGVAFCDFGTVEEDTRLNWDSFRIAPGFGFRVHMPAAGMGGAPLAFDFAFPVNSLGTDDEQIFSFYMGVIR